MRKVLLGAGAAVGAALLGLGLNHLNWMSKIGAGLKTPQVCNAVFLAGRDPQHALEHDFVRYDDLHKLVSVKINYEKKEAIGGFGPLGRTKAVFRPGYGCTLVKGKLVEVPTLAPVIEKPLVYASPADHGFDADALENALDKIFEDALPDTRTILLVRNGKIIAERYAQGFNQDMPMHSYSMAKTVSQMMVGAALHQGLLSLDDRPDIDEWSGSSDPRRKITWRHLLQMQPGLEWGFGGTLGDEAQMLYYERSAAQYAIDKPLLHKPGTQFTYSSGTSAILQRGLQTILEDKNINYHSFARDNIIEPLGASSVVLVPDSSGTFYGGLKVYATPRDWAKLGQLLLQDGVWNDQRILPEGWVEFVSSPASASSGIYGAQMWLNRPHTEQKNKYFPKLPDDAFMFWGYLGQFVILVPSLDMIIVHMGRTSPATETETVNKALDLIMPTLQRP